MLGVTIFGLLLTPLFCDVIRRLTGHRQGAREEGSTHLRQTEPGARG
jgi:hypothetical protein